MTNAELHGTVSRLRAGELAAFDELYRELSKPLFTTLLRLTRDRGMAEDILQDAFVRLYEAPPGDDVKNPAAWLFRVARNLAIDQIRRESRQQPISTVAEPERPAADHAGRLDLEEAMALLPVERLEVVTLHLNAGFTFREIADLTGRPIGTVQWQYHRALGELRKYLAQDN